MDPNVGFDVETRSCSMHTCTRKAAIGGSTYKNLKYEIPLSYDFSSKGNSLKKKKGFSRGEILFMFSTNKEDPLCK